MNPVTSITPAPEAAGVKAQAGKPSKDAGADFQSMLESAINTPEATRETQQSEKGDAKAAKFPEAGEESGINPENENEAVNAEISAAMTAAVSVTFGQQIETIDAHASPGTAQEPIEETRAQAPAPPETPAAQAESKAHESRGQEVPMGTEEPLQAQESQKEQSSAHSDASSRGTNVQKQHYHEDAPASDIHRELRAESYAYRISRAPAGEEASKLGEMFQKAARELGQNQNKPVTIEVQNPAEEAAIEEPKTADVSEKAVGAGQKEIDEAGASATQKTNDNHRPNVTKPEQSTIKASKKLDHKDYTPSTQAAREPEATVRETEKPSDAKPQPVRAPDQIEQIRAQVIRNIEQERMEFRMQLNPQELGRINVKMILEGGKLAVQITAFNPKAADMLTRQADGLIAALKTGNMEVSSVNIVTAGENVSADMNSEYNLANPQRDSQNPDRPEGAGRIGEAKGETESGAETEEEIKPQGLLNYLI